MRETACYLAHWCGLRAPDLQSEIGLSRSSETVCEAATPSARGRPSAKDSGGRGRLPRSPAPSERSVRAGLRDGPHRDAERDKLLFCLLVMASVIRPSRVAKSRSSAAYTSLASGSAFVAMISQMIE